MKYLEHKFIHMKNELQSISEFLVTVSLRLKVVFRQILVLETLHG